MKKFFLMNPFSFNRISLCLVVAVIFSQSAIARSIGPNRPDLDKLRQKIYEDWAPSNKLTGIKRVDITARGIANGQLYDVALEISSGDRQLDADCLQAVMGASCSCPLNIGVEAIDYFRISFDSKTKAGHLHDGISKYFIKHPDKTKKYIAFYRIPLTVLQRYPGVFNKEELLDENNIGLIAVFDVLDFDSKQSKLPDNAIEWLRFLYQHYWVPFFNEHPSATKEQILEFKKKNIVDEKQLFED